MKRIYNKIDRIRAYGYATLDLQSHSPYFHHNGKRFPVIEMGTPSIKCRVSLLIDSEIIDFTLDQIL